MNKVEKIHPVTPRVVSNRVIISNKVFTELIDTINANIVATNSLIDAFETLNSKVEGYNNYHIDAEQNLETQTNSLREAVIANKESTQALAAAIQVLQNI